MRASAPIITFYSYKGGTGRSMGLANTAWIMASRGLRVLAIDWDLEAPGLHRFFHPFLPDRDLRSSPGLIDLVWEFATAAADPAAVVEPGWHERFAVIQPYAVSVEYRFPGAGTIDLVPAGRQDHLYSSLVTSFDWNNFYERLGGGGFLEALKRGVRERYDYVLVDSRTGLSDTAGICTVQLPDILVNCFTMSTQAIDGAAAVAASVHRQRRNGRLRMFPVPMRVEDGEHDKLEASRDYARNRFGRFLSHVADPERYWGEVEVPYRRFYAYEEILATVGDRPRQDNTVLAATERLVDHLTDGRVTGLEPVLSERERRQLLGLFQRRPAAGPDGAERLPAGEGAPRVFITFAYDSAEHFEGVGDFWFALRGRGIDARLDLPPGQRRPDWPRWQDEQLRAADLVILVASPAFRRRPADELDRLRDRYDADPGRFMPLVLPGGSAEDLPDFVAADAGDVRSVPALTPEDLQPLVRLVTEKSPTPRSGRSSASSPPRWANRDVDSSIADAVKSLRRSVLWHCRAETAARGLADPRPLSLRWALTRRPVVSAVFPHPAATKGRSEELAEAFLSMRRGRLVLLGAPGSGKTATALTLAEALIERRPAAGSLPIPVLLPATSWDPRAQDLEDWLIDRLRADHPARRGDRAGATPDVAQRLVRSELILPVIDGLDEMPPDTRTVAISALERAASPTIPFVVTCRTEEYEQAVAKSGRPISDAAVLELQPVSVGDAMGFLLDSAISTDSRWRAFADHLHRHSDDPVAVAFRTPLMVWLTREIYRSPHTDPVVLFDRSRFPDPEAVERRLLTALIPAAYDDKTPVGRRTPSPGKARDWLAFLARHMAVENTLDLAWWELHRALPSRSPRLMLCFVGLLVLAVAAAPIVWIDAKPDLLTPLHGLIAGAAVMVTTVAALTARAPKPPRRRLRFRRLSYSLIWPRTRSALERAVDPSAVLRADRRATLGLPIGLAVAVGVFLWVAVGTYAAASWPPEIIAGAVLAVATAFNLSLRDSAWARFALARTWLAIRGRLPWRLMSFLEDARERGVLRRAGPVYEFRYTLLRDALGTEPITFPRRIGGTGIDSAE